MQLLINQLVEIVAQLQAQLVAMQEAENQLNQPSVGAPAEPTPEPSGNATQDAPVVDPQMPPFTIELLKTPLKLSGDIIVWRPMKDGKVMRDMRFESKPLIKFEKAEVLLNNELVRTYLNTPETGKRFPSPSWAQDWYEFWIPGTTEDLKDSLILRVTIDGETLSVNVPLE